MARQGTQEWRKRPCWLVEDTWRRHPHGHAQAPLNCTWFSLRRCSQVWRLEAVFSTRGSWTPGSGDVGTNSVTRGLLLKRGLTVCMEEKENRGNVSWHKGPADQRSCFLCVYFYFCFSTACLRDQRINYVKGLAKNATWLLISKWQLPLRRYPKHRNRCIYALIYLRLMFKQNDTYISCAFFKACNPCNTNFATANKRKSLLTTAICNSVRKIAPNIQQDNFPSKKKKK